MVFSAALVAVAVAPVVAVAVVAAHLLPVLVPLCSTVALAVLVGHQALPVQR